MGASVAPALFEGRKPHPHCNYAPKAILVFLAIARDMDVDLLSRRRVPAVLPLIKCPENAFFRLTLPVPVILTRLANPLCVFCLGIVFFHFLL